MLKKRTKMKLFCFHYAGGSQYNLLGLKQHLHTSIETFFFELPGRGKRVEEPLMNNIEEMVLDLYKQVKNHLEIDDKYILYGHSLGGILTLLVARLLKKHNHTLPVHIISSGTKAPKKCQNRKVIYHKLNEEDFKKELFKLGGVPTVVIENKELMDFYLPIFMADFTASETYIYRESTPLDIPITALSGKNDDISKSDLNAWNIETTHAVEIIMFEGDHFFIFKKFQEIGEIINKISRRNLL